MKDDSPSGSIGLSTERLSLILAICAILISGASFYATYLQADSAEKQVKAMTLPLLQFSHGNYNPSKNKDSISFNLKNAGVGPAIIKTVAFKYKGHEYKSSYEFFGACCRAEWSKYKAAFRNIDDVSDAGEISQPLLDVIIPGQTDYYFQTIDRNDLNNDFWLKLNKERWLLKLEVCYCSLLDECYTTEESGVFNQTKKCSSR